MTTMNKTLLIAVAASAAVAFTSCKSQESAYRKAYLAAQENAEQSSNTVAVVSEEEAEDVAVSPVVTPAPKEEAAPDMTDVRTINSTATLIKGNALKTYSVVVGSFQNEANALGLYETLTRGGNDARVLRTNETINGLTGWYRVVASSYADKASAISSRNSLKGNYPGAWVLYMK